MSQKLIIMIDYYPARLVQAKKRWYFCFYQTDPTTGKLQRHRESFNIGRIPPDQRLDTAKEILQSINARLPYGYPYDEIFFKSQMSMSIGDALDYISRQDSDLRKATIDSYRSWVGKFKTFAISSGLIGEDITTVNKKVALAYADHLIKTGISARTFNNDINGISRAFEILKTQEFITANPFLNIPRRRVQKKERTAIHTMEALQILHYIKDRDVSVYVSCLLLFYCMIRPNEARQLQRKHFNLAKSLVFIPGASSKNRKSGQVTIPDEFRDILIASGIDRLKSDDYLLGINLLGRPVPVSKSLMSNRYRQLLNDMINEGLLACRAGNTLYSWKDTGGDALAAAVSNAVKLKNQFRHHSLDETQQYLSSFKVADIEVKTRHKLPVIS